MKSDKSENCFFETNLKDTLNMPFNSGNITLMLCTDGFSTLSIDFKERPFCKGDLAVVPDTMTLIPLESSEGFQAMVISVSPENCEEMEYKITDNLFWDFMCSHPVLHPDDMQYGMLKEWFGQMRWLMDNCCEKYLNKAISSSICTFFMMLYSELESVIEKSESDDLNTGRVGRLMSDFNSLVSRYHKKHREVSYYADMLSITPDYLNKLVKSQWKMSAKEYIDWQAVMAIKEYLTATDMPVKMIAIDMHYDDSSYMCRFFRKMTGMSPTEFREQNKKTD